LEEEIGKLWEKTKKKKEKQKGLVLESSGIRDISAHLFRKKHAHGTNTQKGILAEKAP